MSDVLIAGIGNNQVLQYNTGDNKWHNQTLINAGIVDTSSNQSISGVKSIFTNNASPYAFGVFNTFTGSTNGLSVGNLSNTTGASTGMNTMLTNSFGSYNPCMQVKSTNTNAVTNTMETIINQYDGVGNPIQMIKMNSSGYFGIPNTYYMGTNARVVFNGVDTFQFQYWDGSSWITKGSI